MEQPALLVRKHHARGGDVSIVRRRELDRCHGRVVQDVEVAAVLCLSVECIKAGAPPQPAVQTPCALFDARVVPVVEFVDDGDVDGFAGLDEADVRVWHEALESDLQGPVGVSVRIPRLEPMVVAVVQVGWVEMSVLRTVFELTFRFREMDDEEIGEIDTHLDAQRIQIVPTPAWVAQFDPVVIDGGTASSEEQTVNDRTAAESFPTCAKGQPTWIMSPTTEQRSRTMIR